MKFKSLLLRQRAASDFRLRRVFALTRRGVSEGAPPRWTTGEKEAPGREFSRPGASFFRFVIQRDSAGPAGHGCGPSGPSYGWSPREAWRGTPDVPPGCTPPPPVPRTHSLLAGAGTGSRKPADGPGRIPE